MLLIEKQLQHEHIEKQGIKFVCNYGNLPAGTTLWDDIAELIRRCDFAIFDISENNPNVMLEVGYALGLGKHLILLKNSDSKVSNPTPSDINSVYISYQGKDRLTDNTVINKAVEAIIEKLHKKKSASDFYFRSLWGFDELDDVTIICSELDEPEKRQHLEPNEYLYLGKYGDLDALVTTIVTMHKIYPNLHVKFYTGNERMNMREPYTGNIILIGGPDYNAVAKHFERYCPFEYQAGKTENDISIKNKETGELFKPKIELVNKKHMIEDYGFFVKIKNPFDEKHKLIMIGGPHTYGVLGAARAFSDSLADSAEISFQNCKDTILKFGVDPEFSAVFPVHCIENSIQTPKIDKKKLQKLFMKKLH